MLRFCLGAYGRPNHAWMPSLGAGLIRLSQLQPRVVGPHVVARGATCDRRPAASMTTGPNDDDVDRGREKRERGVLIVS